MFASMHVLCGCLHMDMHSNVYTHVLWCVHGEQWAAGSYHPACVGCIITTVHATCQPDGLSLCFWNMSPSGSSTTTALEIIHLLGAAWPPLTGSTKGNRIGWFYHL